MTSKKIKNGRGPKKTRKNGRRPKKMKMEDEPINQN
jgi:hypothetical protein